MPCLSANSFARAGFRAATAVTSTSATFAAGFTRAIGAIFAAPRIPIRRCSTLWKVVKDMGKLIYSTISSFDGYVQDESGSFEWAAPDDEVHAFVNDLERPIGTYLYGRKMYEVMVFWDSHPTVADDPGPDPSNDY